MSDESKPFPPEIPGVPDDLIVGDRELRGLPRRTTGVQSDVIDTLIPFRRHLLAEAGKVDGATGASGETLALFARLLDTVEAVVAHTNDADIYWTQDGYVQSAEVPPLLAAMYETLRPPRQLPANS